MKTLEELEDLYNSHPRESHRLLTLCDEDMKKLELLYVMMKRHFVGCVPGTKEEVEQVLALKRDGQ